MNSQRSVGRPPRQSPYKRTYADGRVVWIARCRDLAGKERYAKPRWNGGKSTFARKGEAQRAIDEELDQLYGARPGEPQKIELLLRVLAEPPPAIQTDEQDPPRPNLLGTRRRGRGAGSPRVVLRRAASSPGARTRRPYAARGRTGDRRSSRHSRLAIGDDRGRDRRRRRRGQRFPGHPPPRQRPTAAKAGAQDQALEL